MLMSRIGTILPFQLFRAEIDADIAESGSAIVMRLLARAGHAVEQPPAPAQHIASAPNRLNGYYWLAGCCDAF